MIECPIGAQQATPRGADEPSWQAVARSVVEPSSGRITIGSPVVGRIGEVLVNNSDKVFAGELLVRLDDQEARARVATAEARVECSTGLRNDQTPGKAAERRRAEDAVAVAAAALVGARDTLDSAALERQTAGEADAGIERLRSAWKTARETLNQKWMELRKIEADVGTPLPTENEGQLNVTRLDL